MAPMVFVKYTFVQFACSFVGTSFLDMIFFGGVASCQASNVRWVGCKLYTQKGKVLLLMAEIQLIASFSHYL